MPIKLKKTNIQYDIDNPEKGWIIIGADEDGNLVQKNENGDYTKVIKDESYGIYIKLETEYLTIGNRLQGIDEGLYSYSQGEYNESSNYISTSRGQFLKSNNVLSFASGRGYGNTSTDMYYLHSSGINSFVHSYSISAGEYGSDADYSVILGGTNQIIQPNATSSVILGGRNNTILENISGSTIIGGNGIIANQTNTLYTPNIIVTGLTSINLTSTNTTSTNLTSTDTTTFNLNVQNQVIINNNILPEIWQLGSNLGITMVDAWDSSNKLFKDTTGTNNTALGLRTLTKLVTGSDNTAVGYSAGVLSTGNENTFIGASAGSLLTFGSDNTLIGEQNNFVSTGNDNVGIGAEIFSSISGRTHSNCIYIGSRIVPTSNASNEIIIGKGANGNGNNTITLGKFGVTSGTYLYGTVYTETGTVSASDERLKTEIRKLTENELNASKQLLNEIGLYKFLQSVKDKGDSAREHVGMTVQKAIQIMENNNLDPFNYAFICKDFNKNKPLDPIYSNDPYKYAFRYTELILFIVAGLSQEIDTINSRLEILESK